MKHEPPVVSPVGAVHCTVNWVLQ